MKPKTMMVLEMCIEEGLSYGWNRAYKQIQEPNAMQIRAVQRDAIMELVYEWFDMGEEGDN